MGAIGAVPRAEPPISASFTSKTSAHTTPRPWPTGVKTSGSKIDAVRALGFDERFIRTWHYYLCYCEAGFRERQIGVSQLLLTKPACRREPVLAGV